MPYQVQMVYRALEYAACHGALVIGAAGNKIGGERNAYYPAAWEKRPAPNYYYCSRYLKDHKPVRSDFATSTRVYRPIIYAVGGLQGTDKPLANSLPYGMPKLAAYGDHATVQSSLKVGSFYKSTHTTTLTGSSVSSLIVSATASAVWYYKPSLAPHKVMDLVYKTGKWMPFYARFKPSPYSSATRVKQVVFCNALKTVCASGGGNCPASGSYFKCATPKKSRASLSSISSLATFESSADSVEFSLSSPSAPSYQALKAVPWSFPQPGSEPCANCIVDSSNGDLYIEWDSDYDLSNVGIMVNGSSYSLGSDVSGSNYSAVVDLGISGSWDSASLYYNVSDGSSSYWDDSSLYVGW